MKVTPVIALSMLLASVQAAAQKGLVDPTRPPTMAPSPQATAEAPEPPGPQLQSVLLAPGRKIAVINGESVALGEKLGEETLVRVTETEVTLKRGREMRVLKLYPSVEKSSVRQSAVGDKSKAKGESKR
jgi:MSHA biogenesis protein MshK